jgi:hypothetical protein
MGVLVEHDLVSSVANKEWKQEKWNENDLIECVTEVKSEGKG